MNIIAKGGYCMVDLSGIKINSNTYQSSQGVYDKIADAYNSAKPIILCGLTDGSLDASGTGRAVSPVHAYIKRGLAVGGASDYQVCFGQVHLTVLASDPNRVLVSNDVDNFSEQIDDLDSRVTALEEAGKGE